MQQDFLYESKQHPHHFWGSRPQSFHPHHRMTWAPLVTADKACKKRSKWPLQNNPGALQGCNYCRIMLHFFYTVCLAYWQAGKSGRSNGQISGEVSHGWAGMFFVKGHGRSAVRLRGHNISGVVASRCMITGLTFLHREWVTCSSAQVTRSWVPPFCASLIFPPPNLSAIPVVTGTTGKEYTDSAAVFKAWSCLLSCLCRRKHGDLIRNVPLLAVWLQEGLQYQSEKQAKLLVAPIGVLGEKKKRHLTGEHRGQLNFHKQHCRKTKVLGVLPRR